MEDQDRLFDLYAWTGKCFREHDEDRCTISGFAWTRTASKGSSDSAGAAMIQTPELTGDAFLNWADEWRRKMEVQVPPCDRCHVPYGE